MSQVDYGIGMRNAVITHMSNGLLARMVKMSGNQAKNLFSHPDAWNQHIRKLDQEKKLSLVSMPMLYQARRHYTLFKKTSWNSRLDDPASMDM
jgi:hypothetical protein